jgi:hypothetical protein
MLIKKGEDRFVVRLCKKRKKVFKMCVSEEVVREVLKNTWRESFGTDVGYHFGRRKMKNLEFLSLEGFTEKLKTKIEMFSFTGRCVVKK